MPRRPMPHRPVLRSKGGYQDTYVENAVTIGLHTVVVIRGDGWTAELAAAFRQALNPGVVLLHLAEDMQVETYDEEAMRLAGWVRG